MRKVLFAVDPGTQTVDVCRTLSDGLQILNPFVRFVVCDPCCTAAYQQLRLTLMSSLCLKSIDNLTLIRYLLQLVPLMPVIAFCYHSVSYLSLCKYLTLCSFYDALFSSLSCSVAGAL